MKPPLASWSFCSRSTVQHLPLKKSGSTTRKPAAAISSQMLRIRPPRKQDIGENSLRKVATNLATAASNYFTFEPVDIIADDYCLLAIFGSNDINGEISDGLDGT